VKTPSKNFKNEMAFLTWQLFKIRSNLRWIAIRKTRVFCLVKTLDQLQSYDFQQCPKYVYFTTPRKLSIAANIRSHLDYCYSIPSEKWERGELQKNPSSSLYRRRFKRLHSTASVWSGSWPRSNIEKEKSKRQTGEAQLRNNRIMEVRNPADLLQTLHKEFLQSIRSHKAVTAAAKAGQSEADRASSRM